MDKVNNKTAFKIELLYRWTNTETGHVELVSRLIVVLRDTYEEAKRESMDLLTDVDTRFRDDHGAIIEQDPIEVVSIVSTGTLGAEWMVESSLEIYGFDAGVVRHRKLDDLSLS